MDVAAILALVTKGLTIIGALIEAGASATPAIQALTKLVTGAQQGTVSDADLGQTEALLDKLLDDFDLDIPEG